MGGAGLSSARLGGHSLRGPGRGPGGGEWSLLQDALWASFKATVTPLLPAPACSPSQTPHMQADLTHGGPHLCSRCFRGWASSNFQLTANWNLHVFFLLKVSNNVFSKQQKTL